MRVPAAHERESVPGGDESLYLVEERFSALMTEAGSGGGECCHWKQEPRCHKTHRQLSHGGVHSVLSGELQSAPKGQRDLALEIRGDLGSQPRKGPQ